jgi:lipopolysaccharide cholinephosphotransferase
MKIDQETMVHLRKVMLEILDEFVRICEENNLIYFLTAGTLLGAIRHKGFIPWDDDIDIAMPRNDYEKFIDIFQNIAETNYYVLSHKCPVNTFYHYKPFAKFCKKGTVFAESHIKDPVNYSGIWIDIWPFDNCIYFLVPFQKCLIAIADKLYRLKTCEDIPKKKVKLLFSKLICFIFSLQFCKSLVKISYSFFNKYSTRYISFFSGNYSYKRETHMYNIIFPLENVLFEGKYYKVPGKWDIFLKELYDNNYMELPPVDQRKIHESKFILFESKDNK